MNQPIAAAPSSEALPHVARDLIPAAIVGLLMVAALPLIGSLSSWVTLTIAGLAMGMIIFIAASGLTLVFGLMDVLNFGHGVFISIGGFLAVSVMAALPTLSGSDALGYNLIAVFAAIAAAMVCAGLIGWVFERLLIQPVYGRHLKQILVTMGGLIIGQELIRAVWGPDMISLQLPPALRGALLFGDAAVEKYRLFAAVLGLVVFGAMLWILNRTKLGLLIRAGVEDREMVESLGYRIGRLFIAVFCAGAALAGLGGALWGLYQQNVEASMGAQLNVLIFIVIIIGGLGSIGGSFIGALLVGLVANYTGFLSPKVALFSNILLMVVVLLWRPQGLYPVARR